METNTQTQTEAQANVSADMLKDVAAKFESKSKIVVYPNEDTTILEALLNPAAGFFPADSYKNWCGKVPQTFTGLALVETTDEAEIRLVAFPDMETAFADPLVRDYLYDRYVGRWISNARDPNSSESMFVTPNGPFAEGLSNVAYNFQSEDWVKLLKRAGLKHVNARNLRQSLESSATARANFPRFKDSNWLPLIEQMAANAEANGYSTAWFAHCIATRDLEKDLGKEIDISSLNLKAELQKMHDEEATPAEKVAA